MVKVGGGAIVNTASVAGLAGFGVFGPYQASKHGVVGLSKNAALLYARDGIRVNTLCPGPSNTNLEKTSEYAKYGREAREEEEQVHKQGPHLSGSLPRISAPEEQAEAVIFLCSDEASYINGVALPVDGGLLAGYLIE